VESTFSLIWTKVINLESDRGHFLIILESDGDHFLSRSISCNITESEFWSRIIFGIGWGSLSMNLKWDQNHFLITLGSGVNKSLSLDSGISWKSLPHNLGGKKVRSTQLQNYDLVIFHEMLTFP